MNVYKEWAKLVAKIGFKALKVAFICFRCLLWSILFFVILGCGSYFRREHLDLVWLLLVLISFPITLILIWKQFVSDMKLLRRRYAQYLFDQAYDEVGPLTISEYNEKESQTIPTVTNELFWNTSTGEEFEDLDSYLKMFLHREDHQANQMKSVLSKKDMKSLIMSAHRGVHSIRSWEPEGLISLDFDEPIPVINIESFSVKIDKHIIRGQAVTTQVTKYKGYSYPSFFLGRRNYKGRKKTEYRTIYQPDQVVQEATISIMIAYPNHYTIQMIVKNNNQLVQRICCELKDLGIKQIYA